jgi:hypothetical protein
MAVSRPSTAMSRRRSVAIMTLPARVASGPARNGEPSRMHPALYSPIVVSARALALREDHELSRLGQILDLLDHFRHEVVPLPDQRIRVSACPDDFINLIQLRQHVIEGDIRIDSDVF